jgi:hypothetical protein
MRKSKLTGVASLASLALILSSLVACTATPNSNVLAREMVSAETGGLVEATGGISLEIPPGVLAEDAEATITGLADGKYDIHIAGEWTGQVGVTIPLQAGEDAVLHQIADSWVMEGTDYQQSTVWVSSLSLFGSLLSSAVKLLCKAFGPTLVDCLLGKGIEVVDRQVALWIAQVTGNTCAAELIATAASGTGNLVLRGGQVVIASLFSEACSTPAGETQEYIDAHVDWNHDGIPDKDQQQAAPADPAPAQPAPPAQAEPAPPAPANPPAPSVPAAPDPAPGPPKAWVSRSGDTVTYYWQDMPAGMWPEVDRFRCWRYTVTTHPGGWASDGCGQQAGFAGYPSGSGSVSFYYPGASDSFSIEPWKYGPWLNVGESWQG